MKVHAPLSVLVSMLMPLSARSAVDAQRAAAAEKPVQAVQSSQKLQPKEALPKIAVERRSLKLSCPAASEEKLMLQPYPSGGWSITPREVLPSEFTRAYGQLDSKDSTKVSLACLYDVAGDFTATVSYNGLQKCIANEATGEGKIMYESNMTGYTHNVAGTSLGGYLDTKKTSQQVQGQSLACQFHLSGKAQFFKVFHAPSKIVSCEANGQDVNCFY